MQQTIAKEMQISEEDFVSNAPQWKADYLLKPCDLARTYLNKTGFVETPQRGRYKISDGGRAAFASGEKIDLKYLERFEAFRKFHDVTVSVSPVALEKESVDESPMEQLDAAYKKVNATLASEQSTVNQEQIYSENAMRLMKGTRIR